MMAALLWNLALSPLAGRGLGGLAVCNRDDGRHIVGVEIAETNDVEPPVELGDADDLTHQGFADEDALAWRGIRSVRVRIEHAGDLLAGQAAVGDPGPGFPRGAGHERLGLGEIERRDVQRA